MGGGWRVFVGCGRALFRCGILGLEIGTVAVVSGFGVALGRMTLGPEGIGPGVGYIMQFCLRRHWYIRWQGALWDSLFLSLLVSNPSCKFIVQHLSFCMLPVWSQCNSTAKWPSLAQQSNTVCISKVVSGMPGKSRINESGLKMLSITSVKDSRKPGRSKILPRHTFLPG